MTFTFMILWSYMAFSQYFLIWYANLPEETAWYHHRWTGSWKVISILLPIAHFVVPFFVLMSRAAKRNLKVLAFISVWLLVVHWVDLVWIILPNFQQNGGIFSWMDLATFIALGGFFLWAFWKRFSRHPMVPVGDPHLQASIEFINQ